MKVPRSSTRIPSSALMAYSELGGPLEQLLGQLDVHEIDHLAILVLHGAAAFALRPASIASMTSLAHAICPRSASAPRE